MERKSDWMFIELFVSCMQIQHIHISINHQKVSENEQYLTDNLPFHKNELKGKLFHFICHRENADRKLKISQFKTTCVILSFHKDILK